jgi:hypothetical protein
VSDFGYEAGVGFQLGIQGPIKSKSSSSGYRQPNKGVAYL